MADGATVEMGRNDDLAVDFNPSCSPCLSFDTKKEATKFCVQCKEYLCEDCLVHHSKVTVTKTHELIEKDEVSSTQAMSFGSDELVDTWKCVKHPDSIFKTFCTDHAVLCCDDCTSEDHSACKSEDISVASKGYAKSEGFHELVKTLSTLKTRVYDMRTTKHAKADQYIKMLSKETNAKAKEVAKEILFSYIDKSSEDLTKTLLENIGKSNGQLDDMLAEIQRVQVEVDSKTDLEEALFVLATRQSSTLKRFAKYLKACDERLPTPWIINVNRDRPTDMSTFVSLKPSTKKQLEIKAIHDIDCSISDIHCLLDGRYVIADSTNKSLKLVKRNDVGQAMHRLGSKPLNVIEVEPGKLAVTLPEEKVLQLFHVDDGLNEDVTIELEDIPTGLAAFEQKIFVSFNANIRIMEINGNVVENISKDEAGEPNFKHISCILINNRTGMFYFIDDGYLNSRPVVSIRRQASNSKVDLGMHGTTFIAVMTLDEDNSLYVCTPADIAHLTPELVVLQKFTYNLLVTIRRIELPTLSIADVSKKTANQLDGETERAFGQTTGFGFGGKPTQLADGVFKFGANGADKDENKISSKVQKTTSDGAALSATQQPDLPFPKYSVGFNKAMGRLYIGGESDVINIIQIG